MNVFASLAVAQAGGQPSVWRSIIESFPTDPASLFTLGLAFAVTVAVIVMGRGTGGKGRGPGTGGLSA